jgi:hypothetical protein
MRCLENVVLCQEVAAQLNTYVTLYECNRFSSYAQHEQLIVVQVQIIKFLLHFVAARALCVKWGEGAQRPRKAAR